MFSAVKFHPWGRCFMERLVGLLPASGGDPGPRVLLWFLWTEGRARGVLPSKRDDGAEAQATGQAGAHEAQVLQR